MTTSAVLVSAFLSTLGVVTTAEKAPVYLGVPNVVGTDLASGMVRVTPPASQEPAEAIKGMIAQSVAADRSASIVEFGYYRDGSDPVQTASYLLDAPLDAFDRGIQKFYFYPLTDNGDGFLGLMDSAGKPNPYGEAIHNLTTLLTSTSHQAVKPAPVQIGITGLRSTGHSLLLQKATGVYDLLLWDESGSPSAVNLVGPSDATIVVYNPVSGLAPVLATGSSATVGLGDQPLIAEITVAGVDTSSLALAVDPVQEAVAQMPPDPSQSEGGSAGSTGSTGSAGSAGSAGSVASVGGGNGGSVADAAAGPGAAVATGGGAVTGGSGTTASGHAAASTTDGTTAASQAVTDAAAQVQAARVTNGSARQTFNESFTSLSLGPGETWQASMSWSPDGFKDDTMSSWAVNPANMPPDGNTYSIGSNGLTMAIKPLPADVSPNSVGGASFLCGLMTTEPSFSQLYGYFEVEAKLPSGGSGITSAFWLLPVSGAWPPELDIFEEDTSQGSSAVETGAFTLRPGNQIFTWTRNLPDLSADFHTYAADWEPDTITWYIDGQQVFQTATPSDMHEPMYILLDAMTSNGNWNGSPPDGLNTSMQVRWVKVWTANPYN